MSKKRLQTALLLINLINLFFCGFAVFAVYLYTRRKYNQLDNKIFEGRLYAAATTDWIQGIEDQQYVDDVIKTES